MKVLITGGAGFIGMHLTKRILELGNEVICVDNFLLGKRENVEIFKDNKNYRFIELDISNTNKFCDTFKNEKIDMIYHLAANSDIQKGGQKPDIDYNNTFKTTISVLELMLQNNIKNIFFSSTSAIYGDKSEEIIKEESTPLPISYYGGSKLASESYIYAYTHMNNLNSMIFRFPNVIGPNLTHGVIYDFYHKLLNNPHELQILGDGTQTKQYIYVTDLIDAIIYMTIDNQFSGLNIYNVGALGETTVKEIADIVCDVLEYQNVKYNYSGGKIGWKGDVAKFKYDITKITEKGWHAKYTSTEAVSKTVQSLKEH